MNFKKGISIAAAAAMAISASAIAVYAAEPVTVTLDSSYTGDWSRTTGIAKENFDGFEGDVKVVLQVEAVNVKDGNSYLLKPMDVDKSWDAITPKLTAEKAVCKPDGFMQVRADQTEVEFVVPKDVVADLWGGGIAFQVSNVVVKSATLSDGAAENAITIVEDKDTIDYCAGKFDPWAVAEETPAETEAAPAEETAAEETTAAETEAPVEEKVEEDVEAEVEEEADEEIEEAFEEEEFEEEAVEEEAEPDESFGGFDVDAPDNSIQVGGEGTSNNWGQAVVMYTYNNIAEDEEPGENPFDESLINPDNYIVVYYESDIAPELILQSWSGGEGWAKVPCDEDLSQPGMAVFTYEYMTAMYQSEDLSTLDAVNIGDQGAPLTVSSVYVVPKAVAASDDAGVSVDANTETTEETAAADTANTTVSDTSVTSPGTGNVALGSIAAVMAVAGAAAAVAAKKRK